MNEHPSKEILHRYLDNELSWEERQRVREHLNRCPECARRLEQLRQAEHALRGMIPFAVPPDFTARVMERVQQARGRPPWTRPSLAWGGRLALLLGLIILTVAAAEMWSLTNENPLPILAEALQGNPGILVGLLVELGFTTQHGWSLIAQTAIPLALALIALGSFLQMMRWIAEHMSQLSHPYQTS